MNNILYEKPLGIKVNLKTIEQIMRKRHELLTEIASVEYKKPDFSIVELNNMKEWVKCLEWVLESEEV